MAESKYGKYISTHLKPNIKLPDFRANLTPVGQEPLNGRHHYMEHIFWLDKEVFPFPESFYSGIVWFWPQGRTEIILGRGCATGGRRSPSGAGPPASCSAAAFTSGCSS